MKIPEEGTLLRIFVGESDRLGGKPLYEAVVLKARELQLAGATVFRGILGFGRHSRIHTAKWEALSTDLPIVIEIVDSQEKIAAFMPHVDAMVAEGLVTLEKVRVVKYASRSAEEGARR
jgi:PII-like signaling protein